MEKEPVAGSDPRAAPRLIVPMSLQLIIPRRVALQQSSPPLHQPSVILKEKRNFEKEKLLNCMCTNSKLSQQKGAPRDAVSCLARLFPSTWLMGALGQRFPFGNAGRRFYGFVAKNRYSLSKCRGGACHIAKPEAVRRQARLGTFWSCYTLGFFIRLPLVLWTGVRAAVQRASIFARTHHKRLDLLNGKLTILFLNGVLPNTVPLLFGELFTTLLY